MKKGQQSVYLRERLKLPSLQDEEGKRLITQHRLIKAVSGKVNHFANVKNPKYILDIGSCTGIWGVEMAQHFRQATIILLDANQHMAEQWLRVLCTNRPDLRKRLRFHPGDALQRLPFEDASFDFVHARLISTFVPYAAWPRVVREMVRVTRPGGWIELVDGEYPELDAPAYRVVRAAMMRFLGEGLHLHLNPAPHLAQWLQEAGVEETHSRSIPVGSRGNESIKLADNFVAAVQALREPMVAANLFTPETFDKILPQFRQEIVESNLVWTLVASWGQKPIDTKGGNYG